MLFMQWLVSLVYGSISSLGLVECLGTLLSLNQLVASRVHMKNVNDVNVQNSISTKLV